MSKYILGIDPSLTSTGWAVLIKDTKEVVKLGLIKIAPRQEEDERVFSIAKQLVDICLEYGIEEASMETQFVGGLNKKVALQLSRVRGAVMFALKSTGITLAYYEPQIPKQELGGKGNASKEEVAEGVIAFHMGNQLVADLGPLVDKAGKNKNSDIYDAIAIATTHILRA